MEAGGRIRELARRFERVVVRLFVALSLTAILLRRQILVLVSLRLVLPFDLEVAVGLGSEAANGLLGTARSLLLLLRIDDWRLDLRSSDGGRIL